MFLPAIDLEEGHTVTLGELHGERDQHGGDVIAPITNPIKNLILSHLSRTQVFEQYLFLD